MPHHKSCKKRLKTAAVARVRNRADKSLVRSAVAAVMEAKSYDEARQRLNAACSALDRAARKSVIHASRAARKKSRLYAHVAKMRG